MSGYLARFISFNFELNKEFLVVCGHGCRKCTKRYKADSDAEVCGCNQTVILKKMFQFNIKILN